jgi:hypothetical protein
VSTLRTRRPWRREHACCWFASLPHGTTMPSRVHLHMTSSPCHHHPGASRRAGALEHHRAMSSPPGTMSTMEPRAPVFLPTPHTVAITSPRHGDPAIPEPLGEQHATKLAACFTLCCCISPAIVLCCSLFSLEHQRQWLPWMKLLPLDAHNISDPMPEPQDVVVLLPLHQAQHHDELKPNQSCYRG